MALLCPPELPVPAAELPGPVPVVCTGADCKLPPDAEVAAAQSGRMLLPDGAMLAPPGGATACKLGLAG